MLSIHTAWARQDEQTQDSHDDLTSTQRHLQHQLLHAVTLLCVHAFLPYLELFSLMKQSIVA